MRNSQPISIAAGLATITALAVLFLSTSELPPHTDRAAHAAAGRMLAEEAVRLLEKGGQIHVVTRDTGDFSQPAVDILFASFQKAVHRARASIGKIRSLEVDPLRLIEVPSSDFFEMIHRAQAGDVIVSMMGPPLLSEQQRVQLGRIKPRVVAFCSGSMPAQIDLRRVFEQGVLDAAVVTRHSGQRPGRGARPESDGPRFQTVTAATVGSLYRAATTSP